jgi:hypothetical protein
MCIWTKGDTIFLFVPPLPFPTLNENWEHDKAKNWSASVCGMSGFRNEMVFEKTRPICVIQFWGK